MSFYVLWSRKEKQSSNQTINLMTTARKSFIFLSQRAFQFFQTRKLQQICDHCNDENLTGTLILYVIVLLNALWISAKKTGQLCSLKNVKIC